MNTREERAEVGRIDRKIKAGEHVTNVELARWAYSPFGAGGGCASCHAVQPADVSELLSTPSENQKTSEKG